MSEMVKAVQETPEKRALMEGVRARVRARYGENKQIEGDYDESLAAKCINGTFVGKRQGGAIAYRGIPFVDKQPIGDYRWKAPVDYVADDGVYEAYYNARSPCQAEASNEATLYYQGEDCLYLNVWKADSAAEKRPVMVWIHGGAFEMGATVDSNFDCDSLLKEHPDVIFVIVGYRLGILGFFHLAHLEVPTTPTPRTWASWTSSRPSSGSTRTSRPSAATPKTSPSSASRQELPA